MPTIARLLLASALLLPLATSALAQSNDGDRLYQTLQSMQEQMENLRRENEAMKSQIDELRAKTDADWLTEARANEIRALVADTIADADTRASLLQDGIMAGWSDGFFLADAFGRFLLQVEGMMQTRYVYNFVYREVPGVTDRNRSGFEVTRTRLAFRGHVFNRDIQYLVRGEFSPYPPEGLGAGAFGLLDAWVRYNLTDEWSVRAGQFKLPFLREELVSEAEQLAVEKSLVGLNTTAGRSPAVELAYIDNANSLALAFSSGLSSRGVLDFIVEGPRTNTAAIAANVEYAISARYERLLAGTWQQFRDFTSPLDEEFGMLLGLAMHTQKNESAVTPFVGDTEPWLIGATIDYSVEWGGASAFVAATYHYADHPTFQIIHLFGLIGQVGVYVAPKWEIFARGEWIQIEGAGGATFEIPDLGIATVGFNYYIEGHDVKWTTEIGYSFTEISGVWAPEAASYGWRPVAQPGNPEIVFRTQLQLLF